MANIPYPLSIGFQPSQVVQDFIRWSIQDPRTPGPQDSGQKGLHIGQANLAAGANLQPHGVRISWDLANKNGAYKPTIVVIYHGDIIRYVQLSLWFWTIEFLSTSELHAHHNLRQVPAWRWVCALRAPPMKPWRSCWLPGLKIIIVSPHIRLPV